MLLQYQISACSKEFFLSNKTCFKFNSEKTNKLKLLGLHKLLEQRH